MNEDKTLRGQITALAMEEARTEAGRLRLIEDLRSTLRALGAPCVAVCVGVGSLAAVGVADAVGDLAAALMLAGDHAEYIAEALTRSPDPVEGQRRR